MKLFDILALMDPDTQVAIQVGNTDNIAKVCDILGSTSQNHTVRKISTVFEPELGDVEPMIRFIVK